MQKTTYKLEVSDRCKGIYHASFWLDITDTRTGASRSSFMLKYGSGNWFERERCDHGELHHNLADDEPWAVFSRVGGVNYQRLLDTLFLSNDGNHEFTL